MGEESFHAKAQGRKGGRGMFVIDNGQLLKGIVFVFPPQADKLARDYALFVANY